MDSNQGNLPFETGAMQDNLVEIRNLSFRRSGRSIYRHINLNIPRGKITAIMGPSGTGKTTLLRLIGGQIRPDRGDILFNGQSVPKASRSELFELRRKMGMLFQSGALFTDLNVFDNIAFPVREHANLPEAVLKRLVLMKLESVGLRGAADLMPSELSGGMARRVALARAIALDPCMIMYDEPFTGQDPISMGVLVKLIRSLNDALGLTSVLVSHDVQEAVSIADYIYLLAGGEVMAHGTPAELAANDSPRIRQFMNGEPDGPVAFHYPARPYLQELLEAR